MRPLIILVSGLPGAGKSSFGDAVEKSSLGFTHVPLDKYIMPIPERQTFLQWVREPSCIDWDLLVSHLKILFSGKPCFTPKPDWEQRGRRTSNGGQIQDGPGKKMISSERGYILAGTHAFSLPEINCKRIAVYIDTSDAVIASRLKGSPVHPEMAAEVILEHLNDNPAPLRLFRSQADLVIDGTWPYNQQIDTLKKIL